MTPEKFSEELQKCIPDNVRSIVLYGSAASGEFIEKVSDYNMMVVTNQLDWADLQKIHALVRRWVKAGNPPPLMFTQDRLNQSADVFPMEIADIQQHNKILHGENPVAHISLNRENMRLQVERDLKTRLIQLREALLFLEGKELDQMLVKSTSTFLVLFRHTLRLHGVNPLPPKREAAQALTKHVRFDAEIFQHLQAMREGKKDKLPQRDVLISRYLKAIEAVVDAVDAFVHKEKTTTISN